MSLESEILLKTTLNDGQSIVTSPTTISELIDGYYLISSIGGTCTIEISHDEGTTFYSIGQTLSDGETGEMYIPSNLQLKLTFDGTSVEFVRQKGKT